MAPPRPHRLDGDPLCDIEDKVNVGIVVVVGSTGHWDEVVCQLDVLCISLGMGERKREVDVFQVRVWT